jgi:glucose/arabinose dehydrogenase
VTSRARAAVLLTLPALASCNGSDDESGPMAVTEPPATGAPADDSAQAAATGLKLRRVGTFSNPTYVTAPPGDRTRLFVVEQGGTIRVVQRGRKRAHPYLDIRDRVLSGGERGLLSMAFAPGYRQNHRFYVYYTNDHGDIRVVEFKGRRNRARRRTARPILRQEHSRFGNHNGGQLQFGPDGMLYIGLGDGGGSGDSLRSGQDLGTKLAKILRIDPTGVPRVPRSNPFFGRRGAKAAVYSYGLRNPWRFSFDRKTGDLVIADVGQNAWEEINLGTAGANYGWPNSEGPLGAAGGHSAPLFAYAHAQSNPPGSGPGGFFTGFAIAGGAFYPASGPFPASYRGSYYFADFVGRYVGRLDADNLASMFARTAGAPVDLRVGNDGALYVLTRSGIERIATP